MLKASIIFLSYNQERYVREALASALWQDYPHLEIIIGDDGSTDHTRVIIEQVLASYGGSAEIILLPQGPNLGLIANWNRACAASTGDILIGCAGDDISAMNRVSTVAAIFHQDAKIMAVFSQVSLIDENSTVFMSEYVRNRPIQSLHYRVEVSGGTTFWSGVPVLGACGCYRRRAFEVFGPLRFAHSEDEPYIYRSLLLGAVAYTPANLVQWRWHGKNLSAGSLVQEANAEITLSSRAAQFSRRQDACVQYLADLEEAWSKQLISTETYQQEGHKISAQKSIQALGYSAFAPGVGLGQCLGDIWTMLRLNRFSWAAASYALRSLVKRLAPVAIKLRYSRPLRK